MKGLRPSRCGNWLRRRGSWRRRSSEFSCRFLLFTTSPSELRVLTYCLGLEDEASCGDNFVIRLEPVKDWEVSIRCRTELDLPNGEGAIIVFDREEDVLLVADGLHRLFWNCKPTGACGVE